MKKNQVQSFTGGTRKILLLSAVLLMCMGSAVAQQIFTINGGLVTATAALGAGAAHPTDVGIGTLNPQGKLFVGQSAYTTVQSYTSPFPVDATKEGLLMQSYIVNGDGFRRYSDIASLGYQNGSAGGSILRFMTNDKSSSSVLERVRIDRNGLTGFGLTAPAYMVDVEGDVNLDVTTKAFRIGGNEMLWHNGNTSDIFVGYHAGNGTMTGHFNTLVGYGAGNLLTSSQKNTFVGYQAGKSATAVYNVGDPGNVAVGYQSLYSNPDLLYNTALGFQALYSSSSCTLCWDGHSTVNTAIGYQALYSTQAYGGCALGFWAGFSNTTGCSLVAVGEEAAKNNTTGDDNSAVGEAALHGNTSLSDNVAVGVQALAAQTYNGSVSSGNTALGNYSLGSNQPTSTSTGMSNTGVGYKAGFANTTGSKNTFVGYTADASTSGLSNCGAYGYGAITNASNKYVIGNTSVTVIGGQVGWSTLSDGRFKINVKEDVGGLDFINKLRPVTYNMDTKALDVFLNQNRKPLTDRWGKTINSPEQDFSGSTNIVHSGFIAQEIEAAEKSCGYNSTIVNKPASSDDTYSVNYAELVVPLVKAVQQLDAANKELQSQLTALQAQVNGCCDSHQGNSSDQGEARQTAIDITLSSKSIVLDQNQPNPFKEQTSISYFIPDNAQDVKIIFTDSRGIVLKEVSIPEKGKGQFNVYAQDLSSGTYTYTLVADGVTIDSKKMVCNK